MFAVLSYDLNWGILFIGGNRYSCEGDKYLNLGVKIETLWPSTSGSRLVKVLRQSFVGSSQVSLS